MQAVVHGDLYPIKYRVLWGKGLYRTYSNMLHYGPGREQSSKWHDSRHSLHSSYSYMATLMLASVES